MTRKTIDVQLPAAGYRIIIERGLLAQLGGLVRETTDSGRVLLVVDSNLAGTHGSAAAQSLREVELDVTTFELVATEQNKTLDSVRSMYEVMLAAHLERATPVIALGGGVIGDTAGFAAATFMRGVPLIQVPTTLLAMVDAAVGGKTGVNLTLPSGELGKNLVGSFWQPAAVVVDPEVLRTLEERHYRCGLAECVKHGMIAGNDLLEFIERHAEQLGALELDVVGELIERSARVKVAIVEQDEREAGQRALLNLGHTFGHAIEPIPELELHHGEAVAIGLCAAMAAAVATNRFTEEDTRRVTDLLRTIGLPTRLPRPVSIDRLQGLMAFDKKVTRGALRLILPVGSGRAEIVEDVPPEVVRAAWAAVGADGEET